MVGDAASIADTEPPRADAPRAGTGQLGHSNLGITWVYLQGIDNAEIIETVHARRARMVPVTTSRPALAGTSH